MENLRCRVGMLGVQECIARVKGFRVGVRAKRMGGGVPQNADAVLLRQALGSLQ
jgi:hypothetical protein